MLKKAIRPKYSLQKDALFFDNLYTYTLMDEENWFNFDKKLTDIERFFCFDNWFEKVLIFYHASIFKSTVNMALMMWKGYGESYKFSDMTSITGETFTQAFNST